jgi:hypothetical protein
VRRPENAADGFFQQPAKEQIKEGILMNNPEFEE